MATRRVKRIKRTKKQVHRARGRKTNRHRHTRRQRGGAKITVCERSGVGYFAKRIAITYDTDSQMYTIGNHPYATLKTMTRYNDALASLEIMRGKGSAPPPDDEPVVLNQEQFNRFKQVHCQGSTKPECDAISRFSVPSAVAPSASAASAASASASAGPADDPNADIFRKMNMNELRVTEQIIAFKNNNGEVVHYPADKSKREYNFGNFTIPTSSNVPIPGALKVTFGMGYDNKRTDFALELSMSSISPEFIACMQRIERDPFVEINSIASSSSFFSKSKLIITGTLSENRAWDQNISTFDLNGFVQKFMKQCQSCLEPSSQIAQMRVAGPEDLIRVITSKIDVVNTRNILDATNAHKFVELQRGLLRANNDMEVLKQIDREMDKLLEDTRHDPRRPPPSVPVNRRGVPPPSVPPGSLSAASAPPPGGGGKTRRKKHRH
jgi:hypothetical protein